MAQTLRHLGLIIVLLALAAAPLMAQSETETGKSGAAENETDLYDKINWVLYDTGLIAAGNEDKHILVNFTTSWCGWCKKMEKETFSKRDVIQLITDNFVAVKVDGDSKKELNIDGFKITEKNLTKREFGVSGYPSFCFLKSDGTKLGCLPGYKDKKTMMELLTYIKDKKYDKDNTPSSKSSSK